MPYFGRIFWPKTEPMNSDKFPGIPKVFRRTYVSIKFRWTFRRNSNIKKILKKSFLLQVEWREFQIFLNIPTEKSIGIPSQKYSFIPTEYSVEIPPINLAPSFGFRCLLHKIERERVRERTRITNDCGRLNPPFAAIPRNHPLHRDLPPTYWTGFHVCNLYPNL